MGCREFLRESTDQRGVRGNRTQQQTLSGAAPRPPGWKQEGKAGSRPCTRGCEASDSKGKGSGNSWCPSPRAPLPPESGEDSEDPLATTSARAGVKEHPSPLVTETKTRGPSRQVKVQDAASPRLLPEGGGDPPRAPRTRRGPASAGFFPLHPLLIKVGSLHDNHGERG